jgi:hypothetical protein
MTKKSFEIIQGDSFQISAIYENPSNEPINLSGYTSYCEVRDQPGGQILCATASLSSIPYSGSFSGDGIYGNSASTGQLFLNLVPSKTLNFNYPRSSIQWRITSPSGENITLVDGWLIVDAGTIPNA